MFEQGDVYHSEVSSLSLTSGNRGVQWLLCYIRVQMIDSPGSSLLNIIFISKSAQCYEVVKGLDSRPASSALRLFYCKAVILCWMQ